jgi:chromosome partitioning protein
MHVISVANNKGGVGKSTTAAHVGAALASLGYRVLGIDMDPQGGLGAMLGHRTVTGKTVHNGLIDETPLEESLRSTTVAGFDLVPANIELSYAAARLHTDPGWSDIMPELLAPMEPRYDYIVLDSPPEFGILSMVALTASDLVVVPIQTEAMALRGYGQLLTETMRRARRKRPELRLRILRVMFDGRTLHQKEVAEQIAEIYPGETLTTVVKRATRFADAANAGVPLVIADPRSEGAMSYVAATREIIRMFDGETVGSSGAGQIPAASGQREARRPADAAPAPPRTVRS